MDGLIEIDGLSLTEIEGLTLILSLTVGLVENDGE